MEPLPEATQQGQVRPVSDGITIRKERRRKLQADRGSDPSRKIDRERARFATFCPLNPMRARAHDAGDLANAQSGGHARGAKLTADALAKKSTSPRSKGGDAFSTWHERNYRARRSLGAYLILRQRWLTCRRSVGQSTQPAGRSELRPGMSRVRLIRRQNGHSETSDCRLAVPNRRVSRIRPGVGSARLAGAARSPSVRARRRLD
jgi:hypothetical protein